MAQTDDTFNEEVLIVDDNSDICEMLKSGLLHAFPNLHIHCATTGEEGLKIFGEHKNINLIITDLYLPKMNGFDLCRTIKQKYPWTIIIAMTGYPLKFEFYRAREIGFDDYLQKPFPVKVLAGIVRRELHRVVAWKKIQDEQNYVSEYSDQEQGAEADKPIDEGE